MQNSNEKLQNNTLDLSTSSMFSSSAELEDGCCVVTADETARSYAENVLTLHKTLKRSAILLGVAFVALWVIFYYLVFDVEITTKIATILLLISALIQTSIFSNTVISLMTVVYGKLNNTLQAKIELDMSRKEMRESLLFARALYSGSKTATMYLSIFVVLLVSGSVVMMPEVETDVIRNYTAALLALFSVCNAASWVLVNNAQSSASKTITQLIDEPNEEELEPSELLDDVKEENK